MPTHTTISRSHPPRILIVSRRSVRKNKFIDFVGEFHLDLLTQHNATALILPRTPPPPNFLPSLPPFHGLLLCEGEDISPLFRPHEPPTPPHITRLHTADATPDLPKDHLEFQLLRHSLQHHIPILAICRGAQLLNLSAGGTLLPDVHTTPPHTHPVRHIDYQNYDTHRHPLSLLPHTPIAHWFDHLPQIHVNSYHHQGIHRLAPRFAPMAIAPDGLVEAFYDPDCYHPATARFLVGLQFHPERMRDIDAALHGDMGRGYDYPGCQRVYAAFVEAARAFRDRVEGLDFGGGNRMGGVLRGVWSRYSKEDMVRIVRSGASVHGTRLVYNLIHGAGDGVENVPSEESGPDAGFGADWRTFEKGLLMAESGLVGLRGTNRIKAAVALLEKLTRDLAVQDEMGRGG